MSSRSEKFFIKGCILLLFLIETWLFWAYNLGVEKKEEISL